MDPALKFVPVVQLDRTSPSGGEAWLFESAQGHTKFSTGQVSRNPRLRLEFTSYRVYSGAGFDSE